MLSERDYIEAITSGDDAQLSQLLLACNSDEPLVASITDRRPTNHSIGFGMTLLQFASIRERKDGNPSKMLIDRGAVVDLHSACGLGLIERIQNCCTIVLRVFANKLMPISRFSLRSPQGDRR